jgi:hypothetical protein
MRDLESHQRAPAPKFAWRGGAESDRSSCDEMVGPVLTRALQPFPVPVRTLDAIHLAALEFVRAQKQSVQLASYDERLLAAARFLGIVEWSASQ